MPCAELMRAQWSLMCDLPLHPPTHSPQPTSPHFPHHYREQHSQDESSATNGKEPKTSKQGNPVHSGPNKKITDNVKDGPFSNKTGNNSNAKSGPKMKDTSKKAPRRKYYRPSNDTKTFQINNKGHL